MTELLKDLIDIPERVHRGDFVLKLSEGVADPAGTVQAYVVTPQLVTAFNRSLGLIKKAVDSKSSKAAYLHGSFGAGKSHFMAMLFLLLRHDLKARAVPELAPVVQEHQAWLEGKKFLLVPYHLIGARNLESHILGGYASHVRQLHPEAPPPAVYQADKLLADGDNLRQRMGDAAFFDGLTPNSAGSWGKLEAGWDLESYRAALGAPVGEASRGRLVSDLLRTYFSSFQKLAFGTGEGFVPLAEGLAELSRHAQRLGYHAVILFLDELILWLASHAADLDFLSREGQKLVQLVEAGGERRAIPFVSFIARQRDLRELIGEHVPGVERLSFADVFRHWEGRFDDIRLESRNLPAIVEKRVLKAKNAAARQALHAAFAKFERQRGEVVEALQGPDADREAFRRVYPFSPALIEALVHLSEVLQRERTALKLLWQLLVDRRESLELGDLVPVGALWDVLVEGDEPFTEEMRQRFDLAKRLFQEKLRPLLEAEAGVGPGETPETDFSRATFESGALLLKTLLLAALVPGAAALKALTPARLAALNHGSIVTPLPGHESTLVLRRCRDWAAKAGELRVSEEGAETLVAVQLSGVDTDSILVKAHREDNHGNRVGKVRELLFEALGLSLRDDLWQEQTHELVWRGTRRSFDVLYGNVRELSTEALKAREGRLKVVVDFPFDPEERSPNDDLSRLANFREEESSRTLCWLPSFFSRDALADLGKLVKLDHILAGERFRDYASHLSVVDRETARGLLENQRSQLKNRVISCLEMAFGITKAAPGVIDQAYDLSEHLQSLDPSYKPRPPAGANLRQAFEGLVAAYLDHWHPAHPEFPSASEEIRKIELIRVFEKVLEAAATPDGRLRIEDKGLRLSMPRIAVPLKLGEWADPYFLLNPYWVDAFRRQGGSEAEWTVGSLRPGFDKPKRMGLSREMQDLILLVVAAQSQRSFRLHGAPVRYQPGEPLPDALRLEEQPLPSEAEWRRALERTGKIWGLPLPNSYRGADNVAALADAVRTGAADTRQRAEDFRGRLADRLERLGGVDEARRLLTAEVAARLTAMLARIDDDRTLISKLAAAELPVPEEILGHALKQLEATDKALSDARWELFDALGQLRDARQEDGEELLARLRDVLTHDELVTPLGTGLSELEGQAAKLLASVAPSPSVEAAPAPREPGWQVVAAEERRGLSPAEARAVLKELLEALPEDGERRLSLRWTLEERPRR